MQPLKGIRHIQVPIPAATLAHDILHCATIRLAELHLHRIEHGYDLLDARVAVIPKAVAKGHYARGDGPAVGVVGGGDDFGGSDGAGDKVLGVSYFAVEEGPDLGEGEWWLGVGWVDGGCEGYVVGRGHCCSGGGGGAAVYQSE